MARVVLIHGMGQQASSAALQTGEWLPSLVKGVLLSGDPAAGEVASDLAAAVRDQAAVSMAFYGDLFLTAGVQGTEYVPDAETLAVADSLATALLSTAAERGEPRLTELAAIALSQSNPLDEGVQATGSIVRSAMSRLDDNGWLTARIFGLAQRAKPDLLQVARYLTDNTLRAQIQLRVHRLIADDTRLVIAHSLGSIVGWEACQSSTHALPMLITIGSPLGLDTVVYPRLQPAPPTFPALVERWVNVAHRDDIVAVEPHLAPLFPSPDARRVEDRIPSSTRDHHSATTYLEQADLGRAVAEALRRAH